MLFICFTCDDHVIEDTLGVMYSLLTLVYGTLPDRWARGDTKNQPIVSEKAFVRVNCEVLLRLLRHFHLEISLAQIKFARVLSPKQISKLASFCYLTQLTSASHLRQLEYCFIACLRYSGGAPLKSMLCHARFWPVSTSS